MHRRESHRVPNVVVLGYFFFVCVCVRVGLCLCVWERERKKKRERERERKKKEREREREICVLRVIIHERKCKIHSFWRCFITNGW